MFRKLFGGGKAKPPNRVPSSTGDSATARSLKDRLLARFEQDTDPIGQQAIVQPFRRFDESDFAADPRREAIATALTMTTSEWLITVFHVENDFYPNVRPTEEMCADLSALLRRGSHRKRKPWAASKTLVRFVRLCIPAAKRPAMLGHS